ncbi:MAG: RDD family protein [Rhodocyclaceae bacterium]|nr:RDD family protein [Rhodocyclaceae bacterium]
MLYEALLLIGVVFFGFLVPNVVLGVMADMLLPSGVLFVHAVVVVAIYFLWFWRRDGQTLAMRTWKIRLVSADATAPAVDQLLLRFLLAWFSVFFLGAGLMWAVFDRDRQFLHDRLSGTRLVFTG